MRIHVPTVIIAVTIMALQGSYAPGQNIGSSPAAKSACGPENIKFNVRLDRSPHALMQPTHGKSVVYVFQEYPYISLLPPFSLLPSLTMRVGVDGAWVGANRKRSYFAFTVVPGVHSICVSGQSRLGGMISLYRVVTKSNGIYYFRTQFYCDSSGVCDPLDVESVNEGEAKLLMQTSAYSTSDTK